MAEFVCIDAIFCRDLHPYVLSFVIFSIHRQRNQYGKCGYSRTNFEDVRAAKQSMIKCIGSLRPTLSLLAYLTSATFLRLCYRCRPSKCTCARTL